ncbi:orotate phosphoribosyltransferase [Algiphilus sp.]|uniref:orotate phosphoribosyltransferase n=1 Tax=Algiphilus sp. TaxID=1872431 RepID=UPI003C5DE0B7
MKPYQTDFIRLALDAGVLRFGAFALKSGRTSPYFFNIGAIAGGAALARLADAYAAAFEDAGLEAELLFGPAYKGIPLAATMATALAGRGRDLGFAYNRKEAKDHGEGGVLVGAEPRGKRVVIVDDVLTAGTALRQSVELLRAEGAEPVAAMIALDRQERGSGAASAVQEAEAELGLRVVPLVTVAEVMTHLAEAGVAPQALDDMRAYQRQYGTAAA